MKLTQQDIKQRIGHFQVTAVFCHDVGEKELCMRYLFMAEFYKDFLKK